MTISCAHLSRRKPYRNEIRLSKPEGIQLFRILASEPEGAHAGERALVAACLPDPVGELTETVVLEVGTQHGDQGSVHDSRAEALDLA